MGLKNAGIRFQQMIDDRMLPVKEAADPYIDDIVIGTMVGPNEDVVAAHEKDLREVLRVLKKEEFVCDAKKCRMFVEEVEFCGHI